MPKKPVASPKTTKPEPKLNKQSYELALVDSLVPSKKNPKRGNVDAISESIEENRFYGAVIVQKSTRRILAGEHKWKAAKKEGLKRVPVIIVDVDDKVANRILLVDNRAAELCSYDNSVLMSIMEDTKKQLGSLAGTGYTDLDLGRLLAKANGTPGSVPEIKGQVKMNHTCPKCGFAWQ
jgi:ParB-like chromosome segregation protein Spo0J